MIKIVTGEIKKITEEVLTTKGYMALEELAMISAEKTVAAKELGVTLTRKDTEVVSGIVFDYLLKKHTLAIALTVELDQKKIVFADKFDINNTPFVMVAVMSPHKETQIIDDRAIIDILTSKALALLTRGKELKEVGACEIIEKAALVVSKHFSKELTPQESEDYTQKVMAHLVVAVSEARKQ